MADRFPLILNTSANQIQEIASGDTLDLTGSNINGVGIITVTTIDCNGDLDVDGHINFDNLSIAGVSTFSDTVRVGTGVTIESNGQATFVGVVTFGSGSTTIDNNVVNVGTALTLGHTQGLQFHTQNLHSQGFEINQINASGIITATTFSGSGANLTNLPAGNLTGTVADARISTLTASKLSGALPAISGANLTNLDASDLASGTVPTARLGSGTASSSTFLRGDSTFQTVNTDLVSDTSPQLGGDLDTNSHNILLDDSHYLYLGDTQDASLFNDGSNVYLKNYSGGTDIQATTYVQLRKFNNSDIGLKYIVDGAVELYHDGTKKVETTTSGFKTQGAGQVSALIGSTDAGGAILFLDGDSNGDGSGGDYAWLRHKTTGAVELGNNLNNSIDFLTNSTNRWYIYDAGHFIPAANNTYDIGSTSYRVRNLYTNDLNLSNEGSKNDVDGTWGNYTIQEGESDLFLINKRSGKKYKFNLTEVS